MLFVLAALGPALAVAGTVFTQYAAVGVPAWHAAPLFYLALVGAIVFVPTLAGLWLARSGVWALRIAGLLVLAGLVILVADVLGARSLLVPLESRLLRLSLMAGAFVLAFALLWLLRPAVERVFAAAGLAIFATGVAALLSGTATPVSAPLAQGRADLAPVIVIVTDAAVGIDGIDPSIPEGPPLRDQLNAVLSDHGFRFFPAAFSRYASTALSVPAILDFNWNGEQAVLPPSGHPASRFALVRDMTAQGYRTSVYQTAHVDFCGGDPAVRCLQLDSFNAASPFLPEGLRLPALFSLMQGARADSVFFYNLGDAAGAVLGSIPPPNLDSFLYPKWFAHVGDEILRAGRGQLHILHLLMPHEPYVFGPDCGIEDWDPSKYRDFGGRDSARFETDRDAYFGRYYTQYGCMLRDLDGFLASLSSDESFRDAVIMVTGDHGSRITRGVSEDDPRSLIDNFSALYAIRSPAVRPGADGRQTSVQRLTAEFFGDGAPDGREDPRVVLGDGATVPMPQIAAGNR